MSDNIDRCIMRLYEENTDEPITELTLAHMRMQIRDFRGIFTALMTNRTLTYLDIRHNNLGDRADQGAYALSGVLRANNTITYIDIGYNNIGDDGIMYIADALQSNTSVKSLILYKNNIGPIGGVALAKCLQSNSTIEKLYLLHNNIREEGKKAFSVALETNTTLTVFQIEFNAYESESLIIKYIARNTTIAGNKYWNPYIHETFIPMHLEIYHPVYSIDIQEMKTCDKLVMTSLICGSGMVNRAPMHIWRQIFSFFQRKQFLDL